ncbi:Glycine N-acyltransferase [Tupaia chinensis]|uniref:Glycine N-acyltransferase-like protein n=1 Tax=Tupaia chinensis TaxID=246437 RepID=L9JCY1_TUPCH|nr:Glycine N-acyltransferase [Tupaia chinensis]
MLQVLEKALQKTLPESLKLLQVYGTIFQINQRNPFKLQVLVDGWPNFNTVIIRPEGQEMIDDLDYYTNTYQIYSKNPKELQEVLDLPGIINWKQHLQIQASQSSLNEVIKNIAASRSLLVSRSEQLIYMPLGTVKKLLPSLFDEKKVVSFVTKPKNM